MSVNVNNEKKPDRLSEIYSYIAEFLESNEEIDYEPGLKKEILSYTDTYVTSVIEYCIDLARHANKPVFDIDDLLMAMEMQQSQNLSTPPSLDVLQATCGRSPGIGAIREYLNPPPFPQKKKPEKFYVPEYLLKRIQAFSERFDYNLEEFRYGRGEFAGEFEYDSEELESGSEEFEYGPEEFEYGPEEFEYGPEEFENGPEEFENGPEDSAEQKKREFFTLKPIDIEYPRIFIKKTVASQDEAIVGPSSAMPVTSPVSILQSALKPNSKSRKRKIKKNVTFSDDLNPPKKK